MEKFYLAALAACLGYASQKTMQLIDYYGSAKNAFEALNSKEYDTNLMSKKLEAYVRTQYSAGKPEQIFDYCRLNKVKIVSIFESSYPEDLRTINSPPVLLYIKGSFPVKKKFLSIVGSRRATAYGLKAAEELACQIASRRIVIVSGGAGGINTAAHKGALKCDGDTIAVLGCGIDLFYPFENRKLLSEIAEKGAVISEFPPGTQPLRKHFPMRNRIIVGLSRGVFVVEAALKSGSMITADLAIEEGRDVYCLPGNIYSQTSQGTHALIKDGAILVDKAEDILEDYGFLPKADGRVKIEHISLFDVLPADEAKRANAVLSVLSEGLSLSLEEILLQVNMPLADVSGILLNLQISGLVREQPGKRYIRT